MAAVAFALVSFLGVTATRAETWALGPSPAEARWKSLDLVWDEVDFNGLPKNPRWRCQEAAPFDRVDPTVHCGVNIDARRCTGQVTTTDRTRHAGDCPKNGGHLRWFPVTYEGRIEWDGRFPDGDHVLRLARLRKDLNFDTSGLTSANRGKLPIELPLCETIESFETPWWKELREAIDHDGLHASNRARELLSFGKTGRRAIVTGLFRLDRLHENQCELQPVFALAIRVHARPTSEEWALFVRNWGSEGECRCYEHYLSSAGGPFTIQLPWKDGMSSVEVVPEASAFRTNSGSVPPPEASFYPGAGVWLRFVLPPPGAHAWVEGHLFLRWAPARRDRGESEMEEGSVDEPTDASAGSEPRTGTDVVPERDRPGNYFGERDCASRVDREPCGRAQSAFALELDPARRLPAPPRAPRLR